MFSFILSLKKIWHIHVISSYNFRFYAHTFWLTQNVFSYQKLKIKQSRISKSIISTNESPLMKGSDIYLYRLHWKIKFHFSYYYAKHWCKIVEFKIIKMTYPVKRFMSQKSIVPCLSAVELRFQTFLEVITC